MTQELPGNDGRDKFANALRGEDELGLIIRSHIYIESEIEKYLEAKLHDHSQLGRLEYRTKVRIALACGLRSELEKPLSVLGKIRNKFAHKLGSSVTPQDADDLYSAFGDKEKQSVKASLEEIGRKKTGHGAFKPRDRFVIYVLALWGALLLEQVGPPGSLFD